MLMLLIALSQAASGWSDPREDINVETEYVGSDDRARDRDLVPSLETKIATTSASFRQSSRMLATEFDLTMNAMRAADQSAPGEPPKFALSVTAAQQAWVAYRNSQCRLAPYVVRASGIDLQPIVFTCLDKFNRERIKQLNDLRFRRSM